MNDNDEQKEYAGLPPASISLSELQALRKNHDGFYELPTLHRGWVIEETEIKEAGRWLAVYRFPVYDEDEEEDPPLEATVIVYDEAEINTLDKYAFVITDAPGNLMGCGPTRELAIADAAQNHNPAISFDEAERQVEQTEQCGYQGDNETLCISTREEWEEIAGITLEEWHGEEVQP